MEEINDVKSRKGELLPEELNALRWLDIGFRKLKKYYLYSSYYFLSTIIGMLHGLSHLNVTVTWWGSIIINLILQIMKLGAQIG